MSASYDLIVIGGGSGGVRAARMAATYGAKVAVIEEYRVGGTCVIRGCVPKKLLVYASRFHEAFETAESFGWSVDATFDWPTLIANKDKEIARLERAYNAVLESRGVEVIHDRATLEGPNSVRLRDRGEVIEAPHILIATGGHPFIPDIPGKELGITSNEAFHLDQLPRSILIEGGGYIAVEFATIFRGLGVPTTIVYRGDCLLRGFDLDMRQGLEAGFAERGIRLIHQTTVTALKRVGAGIEASFSDGVVAPFGTVMFATGRRANIQGLGLERAGVDFIPDGPVLVDEYSRTSTPSIYAVGDVSGRSQLTPVAIREGAAFAETVFNNNPTALDHSLIGTAVFSDPEIGAIGLTEEEAASHGDIDVYVARFRPMVNVLSTKTERMIQKLITEPGGGRVLGCHILGPGAAEIIQMVGVAMAMGGTKADFDRAVAIHPTAAEELVTFKAPSYSYRGGARTA